MYQLNGEAAESVGTLQPRGEVLELASALLPEHAHQRQDEIGLVQRDALGVDPHEDLGYLLLFHRRGELDRLEGVITQVVDPADRLIKLVGFCLGQFPLVAQPT